jgi:hypothetical protein
VQHPISILASVLCALYIISVASCCSIQYKQAR